MLKDGYYYAGSALARLQNRRPLGRSIFSADWDICLVLDSTRVDMLRAAWPESAAVDAVWSRGSITTEWLANTFRPAQQQRIARTAYVTATPHSETVFGDRQWLTNADSVAVPFPECPVVDRDAFAGCYELWRSAATEHGAVPPDTMLDATLEAADRHDKVVAHWMQPHEPFIAPDAPAIGGGPTETNVWDALNSGRADPATMWESYVANLEFVLEFVERLLNNINATVLITSDHGNAFGEWGIYGHPFGWPQPAVRKVPWLRVEASDDGPYRYDSVLSPSTVEANTEAQLSALGYR